MSAEVEIAGIGVLDASGIAGTAMAPIAFGSDGLRGFKWKQAFAMPNPAYRHLDSFGRCVALATEASGLARVLPEERRRGTALVLESGYGCLQSDLEFAESLLPDSRISPALFPYTLPSTCLGEVAIRHRLQGPLTCLMSGPRVDKDSERIGLVEARRMIVGGEAEGALVCMGDCLLPDQAQRAGVEARMRVVALVLLPAGVAETPVLDWDDWFAHTRPLESLIDHIRRVTSDG